jgi:Gpi18-like mannosyltransferase
MLSCARSQWFYASVYFALAGTFRSTGILLGGFILWGLIIDPFLHRKHVRLWYPSLSSVSLQLLTSLSLDRYLSLAFSTPSF